MKLHSLITCIVVLHVVKATLMFPTERELKVPKTKSPKSSKVPEGRARDLKAPKAKPPKSSKVPEGRARDLKAPKAKSSKVPEGARDLKSLKTK